MILKSVTGQSKHYYIKNNVNLIRKSGIGKSKEILIPLFLIYSVGIHNKQHQKALYLFKTDEFILKFELVTVIIQLTKHNLYSGGVCSARFLIVILGML